MVVLRAGRDGGPVSTQADLNAHAIARQAIDAMRRADEAVKELAAVKSRTGPLIETLVSVLEDLTHDYESDGTPDLCVCGAHRQDIRHWTPGYIQSAHGMHWQTNEALTASISPGARDMRLLNLQIPVALTALRVTDQAGRAALAESLAGDAYSKVHDLVSEWAGP